MSNRALWYSVYATHIHQGELASEARNLADKAVAAAPKPFWARWF